MRGQVFNFSSLVTKVTSDLVTAHIYPNIYLTPSLLRSGYLKKTYDGYLIKKMGKG
jgi:hypothetical protein